MSDEINQPAGAGLDNEKLRFETFILDQIYDNVSFVDLDGIITYVNKAECEMMGCAKDDLIGKHISVYGDVSLEGEPGMSIFDQVLKKGSWRGEVYKFNKQGKKIYLDNRISLIYDDDGMPSGMVGISTDITENKNAEAKLKKKEGELRKQNRQLSILNEKLNLSNKRKTEINEELNRSMKKAEESDKQKSVFLANMSHEIRTPMNGILGFTNLLKNPGITDEKKKLYLKIIEQSGRRMLSLINDIVDISKIEAGLMEVTIEKTDINRLLKELTDFFRPEAENKNLAINLHAEHPDDPCIVETDSKKLEQIISNLIKNALKFTEEGRVDIGYAVENRKLKLFVSDTGCGIDKSDTENVFQRFWKGHESEKIIEEGTGLGLSITKSLADLLGGRIWLESEPGRGSVFYVSLPLSGMQQPGAGSGKEKDRCKRREAHGKKPEIMIAEDDHYSAEYLKMLLTPMADRILMASNGAEAVQLCKDNPGINIILMDIKMPVMDGLEATRQIRKFNNKVTIIAQTAFTLFTDHENAITAGCNDYITKPIKAQDLKDMITKLF